MTRQVRYRTHLLQVHAGMWQDVSQHRRVRTMRGEALSVTVNWSRIQS